MKNLWARLQRLEAKWVGVWAISPEELAVRRATEALIAAVGIDEIESKIEAMAKRLQVGKATPRDEQVLASIPLGNLAAAGSTAPSLVDTVDRLFASV